MLQFVFLTLYAGKAQPGNEPSRAVPQYFLCSYFVVFVKEYISKHFRSFKTINLIKNEKGFFSMYLVNSGKSQPLGLDKITPETGRMWLLQEHFIIKYKSVKDHLLTFGNSCRKPKGPQSSLLRRPSAPNN